MRLDQLGGLPMFDGPDPEADHERLTGQLAAIKDCMFDGRWRTLAEIEAVTGAPQASVSAQLRHLRKPRFGSYIVDKRRRSPGTWEYRVKVAA